MTRRRRTAWTAVAAVFTAVNFAGAAAAAIAGEPITPGVPVLLGFAGLYLTWRVSPRWFGSRTSQLADAADLPPEQIDRLSQIEQSVDAVAIEVERIGESQRYMTKVLSEEKKPPRDATGPRNPV